MSWLLTLGLMSWLACPHVFGSERTLFMDYS